MTKNEIAEKVVKDFTAANKKENGFNNAQAFAGAPNFNSPEASNGPVNVRQRQIKVIVGFYGNKHYNCDYNKLFKELDIVDYFRYINNYKDATKDYSITSALCDACKDLPVDKWGCLAENMKVYVNVSFMAADRAMVISYDILEGTANNHVDTDEMPF